MASFEWKIEKQINLWLKFITYVPAPLPRTYISVPVVRPKLIWSDGLPSSFYLKRIESALITRLVHFWRRKAFLKGPKRSVKHLFKLVRLSFLINRIATSLVTGPISSGAQGTYYPPIETLKPHMSSMAAHGQVRGGGWTRWVTGSLKSGARRTSPNQIHVLTCCYPFSREFAIGADFPGLLMFRGQRRLGIKVSISA